MRMHKRFKLFFSLALVVITLGASSCFDILEEYEFHADGSGKATVLVDVAKMMDMMEAFGSAMDSTGNEAGKSMDEMFTENQTVAQLKAIPGISNVQDLNNRDTKQIGYSYEFKNIEALNQALVLRESSLGLGDAFGLGGDDESPETDRENSIAYAGKKFSRKMDMTMPANDEEDEESKQYMQMAMMMFQDAKYTVKYSFDRNVKKVKGNDAALIGADKKSVTIENTMKDLLEGKANMNVDLKLK